MTDAFPCISVCYVILACMRHLALNMLRAETTKKASIRREQNIASMDVSYLEKVMEAGFKAMTKK